MYHVVNSPHEHFRRRAIPPTHQGADFQLKFVAPVQRQGSCILWKTTAIILSDMKTKTRITFRGVALLVLAMWFLCVCAEICEACPNCKNGIGVNENLVQGYFWSILFMMSMPFSLLTSFSCYFYFLVRRARTSEQTVLPAGRQ
ncbi:MAG: hypothetical protein CMJ81_09190 [Planctomycetaceae bacterium]|nr:hypothetical protein [Planctomycetaceae bacterium]MBP62940.1 hypothetical protein [Planctomycetaceae bacterium]